MRNSAQGYTYIVEFQLKMRAGIHNIVGLKSFLTQYGLLRPGARQWIPKSALCFHIISGSLSGSVVLCLSANTQVLGLTPRLLTWVTRMLNKKKYKTKFQ